VEHLLILDALHSIRERRRMRKPARNRGADSLRYFDGIGGTSVPLLYLELDRAPTHGVVGARDDDRNSRRMRALDDLAQHARISGLNENGSDTRLRHDRSGQFRRADALNAPSVQLLHRSINCRLI
jgi:hypothetical protein